MVQPIADSTIVTGSDGLVAGEVSIPTRDVALPAYCARPAGDARVPMVLVVQEIFGVHEYIRDVCRRLAHMGYFAVAPELFFRQGDVSTLTDHQEIFAKVVNHVPD